MANDSSDPGAAKGTFGRERPKSIAEALKVLDEALANPSTDLSKIVADEYHNLQETIQTKIVEPATQVSHDVGEKVSTLADILKVTFESAFENFGENFSNFKAESSEKIHRATEKGTEAGREAFKKTDADLRTNPWPYLGGIAVGTFALGILLGGKLAGEKKAAAPPSPNPEPEVKNETSPRDAADIINDDNVTD